MFALKVYTFFVVGDKLRYFLLSGGCENLEEADTEASATVRKVNSTNDTKERR